MTATTSARSARDVFFPSCAPTRSAICAVGFTLFRELIRDLVKSLLGHTVVGVSPSLARGSEACLRHKPDVVILGWTLPDGTGDRLLRDIAPALPDTRWLVLNTQDGG